MSQPVQPVPVLANQAAAGSPETWFDRAIMSGTAPLTRPEEVALIIIDMQNDFAHPDGVMGSVMNADMTAAREIIPRLRDLIGLAREAGALIVYLQNVNLPLARSSSDAEISRRVARETPPDITLKGSWGADFVDLIQPQAGDPVIVKHRRSGFLHTDLDLVLRACHRTVAVCVGMATAACVTATAIEAAQRDYYCYVVSDCVGGYSAPLHDAALTVLRTQVAGVVTAGEVAAAWTKDRPAADKREQQDQG